jgi:hypothetical protein
MSNDLMDLFAADSKEVEKKKELELPENSKMKQLTAMVEEYRDLELKIAEAQVELAKLTEQFNTIGQVRIPDLFDELSLSKLKLTSGQYVEVKRKFSASITAENQAACFEWLQKNGHESIIKHKIDIDLKKGESEEQEKIVDLLEEIGVTYTDKNTVHPQTLLAFVKEQMESGSNFPQELFKVYPLRTTKIK